MLKKRILQLTALVLFILTAAWLMRSFWLPAVTLDPADLLLKRTRSGGAYIDRNGQLLRLFPDARGDFVFAVPLASHSESLIASVLIAEDRNFFSHSGIDFLATLRAAGQNLTSGRIVSGASTITQQLIRVIYPRPRTFSTKLSEMLHALRIEEQLDKKSILEAYLNSVCMFGNIRGIFLASRLLFGKSPDMLTLAESATLAASIQAPGRFNPFTIKGNSLLKKRRNWILGELLKSGHCDENSYKEAAAAAIPGFRRKKPFNAPHFCDYVSETFGKPVGSIRTTVDLQMQNILQSTLKAHLPRLYKAGATQAGAIIADSQNLEILAMAGSAEYGPIAGGFNNICAARRSGGSLLKPFLYALALEKGYYPSYVIPDTMQSFKTPQGEYLPYNANRKSYGPVTIRAALGNSLNISAVKMLNMVGIRNFFDFLVELEVLQRRTGASDYFGLGLAIGNPEISMLALVRAYGTIRNAGSLKSLKFFTDQPQTSTNVYSEQTAFLIRDILSDHSSRLLTFGNPSFFKTRFPTAIKTGTSTDYRDTWLFAVNSGYIIAIWAGNFSGAATRGLSGSSACGPIFKNLIDHLESAERDTSYIKPSGLKRHKVCSISGQPPGPFCPLTGEDFFSDYHPLPDTCPFHSFAGNSHELSTDYASWLKHRKRFLDSDPFKLTSNLKIPDPYSISGISESKEPVVTHADSPARQAAGSTYSDGGLKIVSPHDGDRYIVSSSHENLVLLRAIPSFPAEEVIWLINGSEFIRTPPPYEAYWPMSPGKHIISALCESEFAHEISILVER